MIDRLLRHNRRTAAGQDADRRAVHDKIENNPDTVMNRPSPYALLRRAALYVAAALALHPLVAGAECVGNKAAQQTYRVDVVPQIAPATLFGRWAPALDEIGKIAGVCLELRIAATIPAFEQELMAGKPDFAFVNPYHLVMARRTHAYVPMIRDGKVKLSGLLVTRADSAVASLQQLEGSKVAFPAPNAFAASLLIRAGLAAKGIRITPVYVKTHANVMRAVALGDLPAGGAVNNTFEREPDNLRSHLRVLHETPSYAPHPFVAHPRVPAAQREKLVRAFMQMAATPAGQKLLDDIQIPKPVPADYARDYAPLEQLQLDKFVVPSDD